MPLLYWNFWFVIMDKILFINACVRPCSRTLELAKTLLQRLKGEILEVRLQEMPMAALDLNGLEKRDQAAQKNDFSDPVFTAAKQFAAVTQITSLAITKLDGTAKGGVVIGISDQLKVPVKYIGLGEGMTDLQLFNKRQFVDSLFNE